MCVEVLEPHFDPVFLVTELTRRGESVALCESLTGGFASSLLVDVPGASAVFKGALVTYATELKCSLAGVSESVLSSHGPVSPECACEMAAGARYACAADWGLSLTGVAGPDPQDGHPVGEVWIGIADPHGNVTATQVRPPAAAPGWVIVGDRQLIRTTAAHFALEALHGLLLRDREQSLPENRWSN